MKLSESISKPARYTGGEYGAPDTSKPFDTSVCLCFPDVYEVGMSNLGTRILYFLMNGLDGVVCERCYAPWTDYADFLRDEGSPLVSLENKKPFKDFDFVGFSLQYELSYSNMLLMLDLAGFPLLAKDRGDEFPIVPARSIRSPWRRLSIFLCWARGKRLGRSCSNCTSSTEA